MTNNYTSSLIGAIIIAIDAHLKNGIQFRDTTPPYKAVPGRTGFTYAEVPDWQLRQWKALLENYEAEQLTKSPENVSKKNVSNAPDTLNRCPECGYTKEDALIHWDHHLCKGKIPGYDDQPSEISGNRTLDALKLAHDMLEGKYTRLNYSQQITDIKAAIAAATKREAQSEIPDIEENAWQAINTALAKRGLIGSLRTDMADDVWEAIKPFLKREVSDLFTIASAPKDGTKIKTICLGNDTASCFAITSWRPEICQFASDEMMKRHANGNYWNYSPTHWKPLTEWDLAQDKANAACASASLPESNNQIEVLKGEHASKK